MPSEPYIDRHGLGKRVVDLSFKEGKSDTEIARILTAEGHSMNQSTVTRWLKRHREETGEQVTGILQEHLQKNLPKDLDVIETLETLTYEWALEKPAAAVEAMAEQEWTLKAFERWRMILEAEPDKIEQVMKAILKEALNRVIEFFNVRREKLNFIKSTRDDIALNLQYAGIIDRLIILHKMESF